VPTSLICAIYFVELQVSTRSIWVAVFDKLGQPLTGHLLYHIDGTFDVPEPIGLELSTVGSYRYGGVLVPCCTGISIHFYTFTNLLCP
jgi:hypothetical protein